MEILCKMTHFQVVKIETGEVEGVAPGFYVKHVGSEPHSLDGPLSEKEANRQCERSNSRRVYLMQQQAEAKARRATKH